MKTSILISLLSISLTLLPMEDREIKRQKTENNLTKHLRLMSIGGPSLKFLAALQIVLTDVLISKDEAPEEVLEFVNKLKNILACPLALDEERRFFLTMLNNSEIDIEKHFDLLIKIYRSKNPKDPKSLLNSMLLYASNHMKENRVKAMSLAQLAIAFGANVNSTDPETPLTWASINGNKEMLQLLLDANADINAQNKNGETTLMLAAQNEMVQLLLDANADTSIQRNDGMTALMLAILYGIVWKIPILLEKEKNINIKDNNGHTALIWAAMLSGHKAIVKPLLDNGADPNCQDNDGDTALMCASRCGYTGKIQILLNYGADINIQNNNGDTALTLAESKGHGKIVEMLKEAQARSNL